ncbi:MAG TPA: hypothetical protein VIY71_10635 [Solirubrobacterales bacterium]
MRPVSKISTLEEFSAEIRREVLREWRLRRRSKGILLIVASAAMLTEVLPHFPGLVSVSLSWL